MKSELAPYVYIVYVYNAVVSLSLQGWLVWRRAEAAAAAAVERVSVALAASYRKQVKTTSRTASPAVRKRPRRPIDRLLSVRGHTFAIVLKGN